MAERGVFMPHDWRTPLLEALEAVGMDLETVASLDEAGPVGQWVRLFLSGVYVPPTSALYLAISDLTGIESEVLTGEISPDCTLAVAMRSRGQTAPRQVLDRSLEVLRATRAVVRLEPHAKLWRRLRTLQGRFPHVTTWGVARTSGQQAGLMLRAEVGLGNDPILDLAALVESFGIPVEFSLDLPDGLHGVSSWTQTRMGWIASITINAQDLWTVQRFTLAHEFCHVMHEDRPSDLTTEVWENKSIASDPSEARAEAFASNLLAPRAGLAAHWRHERLGTQPLLIALARVMWQWGLSREAACYALQDCAGVQWTAVHTEEGKAAHVGDMIRHAGLRDEWAQMEESAERIFAPSTWLTEATAELFLDGRLPIESHAAVTGLKPADVLQRLIAVG